MHANVAYDVVFLAVGVEVGSSCHHRGTERVESVDFWRVSDSGYSPHCKRTR